MKIVKQSTTELVLATDNSWGIRAFSLIWGIGFAGIPLSMAFITARSGESFNLSCRRVEPTQVDCTYNHSRFFGLEQISPKSMVKVLGTRIDSETRSSEDSDYEVYQVVVLASNGQFPLADFSSNVGSNQSIANRIDTFLKSPQPTLEITGNNYGSSIFTILFTVPFVLIGGAVLFFTFRSESFVLDRISHVFTIKRKTLLGASNQSYALTEIKSIEVRDSTDSYDRISYVPTIVMSSGKTFNLMSSYNQQGAEEMAKDIRTFLGMQTL